MAVVTLPVTALLVVMAVSAVKSNDNRFTYITVTLYSNNTNRMFWIASRSDASEFRKHLELFISTTEIVFGIQFSTL